MFNMLYKELLEMYENGALNIKYTKGEETATLGGVTINKEQAHQICQSLGWTEYVLEPFEIIKKTAKFMRGIKGEITSARIMDNTEVAFKNVESSKYYGKTFDRIGMKNTHPFGAFDISIIYNMPNNGARYVVYKAINSFPLAKCSRLNEVGEYIEDTFGE